MDFSRCYPFKVIVGLLCVSAWLTMVSQVNAAGNLDFSVSIVESSRQLDKKLSYFDLLSEPGEEEELKLELENLSADEIELKVDFFNGTTSSTGTIVYEDNNQTLEETAPYDLSQQIEVVTPTLKLKAFEKKRATLKLVYPTSDFKGVLLGGIRVSKKEESTAESNKKNQSLGINNHFSIVKGLVLHGNQKIEQVELIFEGANFQQSAQSDHLQLMFENPLANPLRGLNLRVDVTKKATGKTVNYQEFENLEVAPNTKLNLSVFLLDVELNEGDYHVRLEAESGEQTWNFQDDFYVSTEAKQIQVKREETAKKLGHRWQLLLLIMMLMLILLGGSLIYWKKRKSRKRHKRHRRKSK